MKIEEIVYTKTKAILTLVDDKNQYKARGILIITDYSLVTILKARDYKKMRVNFEYPE